ncbi:polysaccharide pyruvyl transferase family protein [Microbacterium sp.]|uniref:polysaccharide pyruvyl transferase family protein n=1 Tax=Microbacterium sp. TaxID=51671 RepID=UPI0039E21B4E
MRAVVLWASEASTNLGVRALARGSRDLLRRVWPDVEVEFVDFGHRPDQLRFGRKRSLIRERVLREHGMMAWLRSFDLVWDTRSGDSFADIYGLDRHLKMSMLYEFAQQAGVPTVLAPQTIGPFGSRTGRLAARRNMRRSSLVYARDPASVAAARELGRPVDRLASDLVFGIDQPTPRTGHDVLLNVSGLLWKPNSHVDSERYQRFVRATIAGLLDAGRGVTLLPHVLDSADHDNDVPVSRMLADEYGGRIDLHVPTDLDDVRETIAGSALVIGSRMHACLNAVSTGTPAIAISYSRKFKPLFDEIGWPHVHALGEPDALSAQVVATATGPSITADAEAARDRGREAITAIEADLRALL